MHKIYEEDESEAILTSRCLQCIQLSQQENISTQYRNHMLTSCQICSKLAQSSFPTFHHWWSGNSIY